VRDRKAMSGKKTQGVSLPLIPLRNMVMFPGVMTNLRIGRKRSLAALDAAEQADSKVVLAAQKNARVEEPGAGDLYDVGVICEVKASREEPMGGVKLAIAQGLERCRVLEWTQEVPHIVARVEPFASEGGEPPADLLARVKQMFSETGEDRRGLLERLPESAELDCVIAFALELPVADKQRLLAAPSRLDRLRMLVPILEVEQEIARRSRQLRERVRAEFSGRVREEYLRSRKEQIQRELAELTGEEGDLRELERRVGEAALPPEARQEADRELARLRRMHSGEPEYAVALDYLEWLLALPWGKATDAGIDLARAREVLDRDHYDRREAKERVLEYLSVRKLKPDREGALLCFVGPPGVGKTSLGRSIAEATRRKFYRISLGGVHDEAEIRGHRRAYLGARPGAIVRALRQVGVCNPVLLLDEVDKLGGGLRGDPAGALLEVLDPQQNRSFVDNYIAVAFDLSRVMFICTANETATIPPPLLDRLEVIELPGYSTEEKVAIAQQYLLPKQMEATGLAGLPLEVDREALELMAERYSREAGVRELERQLASVLRKVARQYVAGDICYRKVDVALVEELLGPPPYQLDREEKVGVPGVCPTLAVSPAGARQMLVEVLRSDGRGRLIVTGRAGEAMRQSAELAFTFWKSKCEQLGVAPSVFRESDFHVHFPAGGAAKEGTAAGLAVALAFASLLADTPVAERLAAVGEISLRGRVLGVEGLRARLAAARRAGLELVIVPERNRAELEAPSQEPLPAGLGVKYVSSVMAAVQVALPSLAAAGAQGRR